MSKQTLDEKRMEEATENFRQNVIREELLARLNKATYEKLLYYIKGVEVLPEYTRLVSEAEVRNAQIEAERQAKAEELINTTLSAEPTPGSLEISSASPAE